MSSYSNVYVQDQYINKIWPIAATVPTPMSNIWLFHHSHIVKKKVQILSSACDINQPPSLNNYIYVLSIISRPIISNVKLC